jgi:hypothetical protein
MNFCWPAVAENKVAIVALGGLAPLIKQMNSPNVEVQCNAVGCITNLATHEDNKSKIARSGALQPLTRLAKSKDMRVQRNATGALLNMTHSGTESKQCDMTWAHDAQTTTDSSWSTLAPFPFLSSSSTLQTSTFNTTVPPLSATSPLMVATAPNLRRPKDASCSL